MMTNTKYSEIARAVTDAVGSGKPCLYVAADSKTGALRWSAHDDMVACGAEYRDGDIVLLCDDLRLKTMDDASADSLALSACITYAGMSGDMERIMAGSDGLSVDDCVAKMMDTIRAEAVSRAMSEYGRKGTASRWGDKRTRGKQVRVDEEAAEALLAVPERHRRKVATDGIIREVARYLKAHKTEG